MKGKRNCADYRNVSWLELGWVEGEFAYAEVWGFETGGLDVVIDLCGEHELWAI